MPIDPAVAIGADLGETSFSWEPSDVLLYHLAIGAGADPVSPRELRYAYEQDLQVLPSFATVAPNLRTYEPPQVVFPGVAVDLAKVVHASQEITVNGPIPVRGKGIARGRIADVFDKGNAAVIVQETTVTADDGSPLWTARSRIYARGEGGFGGERGPAEASARAEPPAREPDHVVDTPTLPQQALLYRLCGDRNPLHADPQFAAAAGFERPILHGLCTYAMVLKAVTDTVLDGDPARVRSWAARFAGVVLPGETLRSRIWADRDRWYVEVEAVERAAPVLSGGVLSRS